MLAGLLLTADGWCLKPAGPGEMLRSSSDLGGHLVETTAGSGFYSDRYLGSCSHSLRRPFPIKNFKASLSYDL